MRRPLCSQVQPDGSIPAMQRAQSVQSAASSDAGEPGAHHRQAGSSAEDLQASTSGRSLPQLPESPTFAIACRYFSDPLNDNEVSHHHWERFLHPIYALQQMGPWRIDRAEQWLPPRHLV